MNDASNRQPSVLVAIGNPEREGHLLAMLREANFTVAGRYLDGSSLVQRVLADRIDAVLVSPDLHRLSDGVLAAIAETGTPAVLLVGAADEAAIEGLTHTVPANSDGPTVIAALRRAIREGVGARPHETETVDSSRRHLRGDGEVVALVSGKGAPGTSTAAIGLAAAFSDVGKRVLLVDGDLRGGSIGPYLDLDPRKGLAGLTVGHAEPASLENELQAGPGFAVLAGIERPEVRERLAPEHVTRAVDALQLRFETVFIDAGETLSGVTSPPSAALIRCAERVLLVTTADLFGLVNARTSLRFLTGSLGVPPEAVLAIVNRHDSEGAYGAEEVERALGVAVVGVIPEDRRNARRALASQIPVTAVRGKAAEAVVQLAERWGGSQEAPGALAPGAHRARRRWRRQPAEGRQ